MFNIYQNITNQKSDTREFKELEEVVLGKNNIVKRFCSKKKPKKKEEGAEAGRKCMMVKTTVSCGRVVWYIFVLFIIKKKQKPQVSLSHISVKR